MDDLLSIPSRKEDHIRINLEEDVASNIKPGFDRFRFIHQALPEIKLDDVDMGLSIFGKKLNSPILISSMTGGARRAADINQRLAEAAQAEGIALGLGSQRAALENQEYQKTFQVRQWAQDILLFANLGAVQLNYGYSLDHCRRAVEMVEADALILHLNPLQEALQPEGDTNFSGLAKKIELICRELPVPVIVKEVGWGISEKAAGMLADAGVAAIDVAGAGGTSWSQVELYRMKDDTQKYVASAFLNWGIPTAESIQMVTKAAPNLPVFASGGVQNGVDIAKAIALGAKLCGLAGPFLRAAVISTDDVVRLITILRKQLQITMFAAGVKNLAELGQLTLEEEK